jgi:tRNA pseudouridine55 synthase
VILCGKATPLCNAIMAGQKRYLARVDLSAFTTTDDREGERTEIGIERPPTEDRVRGALAGFVGEVMQRPPAFSAMKVGGRRAYALARKGEVVELEPRPVTIYSVDLVSYAWPIAELDIRSGKGVYIRSLARDLGEQLGTGGSLAALRRTAIGRFDIEHAVLLDDIPERLTQADLMPLEGFGDGAG